MVQRSLKGSRHGLAHEVLDFRKNLFDRVEVRTVGWKKEEMRARLPDHLADRFVFVAAQIVDYNDIAGLEGLNELEAVHRELMEKASAAQTASAALLASIRADIAEVKVKLASIEKVLQEVE